MPSPTEQTSGTQSLRGADVVVRALQESGVDTIFTLSGNHIMSLFDAALDGPRLIHTRHEAAAVHMADAYGRLSGKPGIAMVTGGPGHANAVAGLYSALAADSPMVLLSGHAPTDELGLGAFQELPQADLARPVTKASWMVQRAEDLEHDIRRAIALAVAGRPGPVHVSLPTDLIDDPLQEASTVAASGSDMPVVQTIDPAALDQIRQALASARRPIVVGGASLSQPRRLGRLKELCARLGLPIVTMESPRGLNDPSIGAFAEVMPQADLLLLIAKPMDFTLKFGRAPFVDPGCRIVSLEPDQGQRKLVLQRSGMDIALAADPDAALDALSALDLDGSVWSDWADQVWSAVKFRPPAWQEPQSSAAGRVHPLSICHALDKVVRSNPEMTLICDGGEVGQWVQTVPHVRRLTNSVSGAIGASLPFAIAARLVDPQHPVIAVMGDGTVGFYLAEFDTAVRYGLPLVIIVGNDACWNAEKQIQIRDYGPQRAHGCELLPTRYDLVCESMGGKGILVTDPAHMDDAIAEAISSGQPTCINVMIDGRPAPVLRRPV